MPVANLHHYVLLFTTNTRKSPAKILDYAFLDFRSNQPPERYPNLSSKCSGHITEESELATYSNYME
ncbi:hypothetical protein LCGC14_2382680 [marine sediment metagenome]|uniref:Uncharacterized protein n=1 Tax=marine sediment metagenome TaxID=412755 RepID=A0A0F9EV31_9ZZZZ